MHGVDNWVLSSWCQ